MARSWPAIAAKPRATGTVFRRVREAGMAPTLTSLSLTMPKPHSYPVGVSDTRAVNFSSVAFRRRQASLHVKEAIPMDAVATEQQKKIPQLQAILAKGLQGTNKSR